MIYKIAESQVIYLLHIDPLVLDHLQSQQIAFKVLDLDIVILIENSIPIELHHVQDRLKFITNEENLNLFIFRLSEITAIISLDPTLEYDGNLESNFLHLDFHQDHVLDMRLHLEDLSIIYNQVPLKIMTTRLKTFRSEKTS